MVVPTKGALDLILANREIEGAILKVLGHKNVPGGSAGQNRYRLLLSDGEKSHSFCMLATQMNHLIEEGKLNVDSLIRVNKFVCNSVQSTKTVLIILELDVIDDDGTSKEVAGPSAPAPAMAPRVPLGEPNGSTSSPQKSNSFPSRMQESPVTPRPSSNFRAAPSSPATPGGTPLGRVFPISSLNPYQNRWTIRARVSQKSSIRTWSNARGEGKLFSFILSDESGDIKVAAFRDEVDRYFEMIQINKCYFISRATLKTANPQYNSTKNDYEMTLNSDSQIIVCDDGDGLPQANFNFVKIGNLESVQPNDFVDIVAIVHDVGEVQSLVSRTSQRELRKRDLTLVDDSRCQVRLTLWSEEALNFPTEGHPVIVGKALRVSDFGGRSLSTTMGNSTIMISPAYVPEAVRLRGWYEHEGRALNFDSYRSEGGGGGSGSSQLQSLADLKAGGIGTGEKADYMSVVGTVISMKRDNCMYQACSNEGCNKKVIDMNNGLYRCEKCNTESPQFKWRLLLSANIADYSENQWVTCFQDTAETLIGISAQELGNMKELQQTSEYDNVFQEANFKSFNFRLRAKMETYNDETRLKVIVADAKKIDTALYAKQLMTDVRRLLDEMK